MGGESFALGRQRLSGAAAGLTGGWGPGLGLRLGLGLWGWAESVPGRVGAGACRSRIEPRRACARAGPGLGRGWAEWGCGACASEPV
ncbi:hypothetical protein GCM10009548_10220 [Streptomyces malaysiensis subsp. malaysiensis]